MNIFRRTKDLPEAYRQCPPVEQEKPVPPADFENLPDLHRGCESIKYNFRTFEYNYFPGGQLRHIAAKFLVAFGMLVGFGILLFSGIKILQIVLEPLPGILATAIISLVMGMVVFMLVLNFFKIPRLISRIAGGRINSNHG